MHQFTADHVALLEQNFTHTGAVSCLKGIENYILRDRVPRPSRPLELINFWFADLELDDIHAIRIRDKQFQHVKQGEEIIAIYVTDMFLVKEDRKDCLR